MNDFLTAVIFGIMSIGIGIGLILVLAKIPFLLTILFLSAYTLAVGVTAHLLYETWKLNKES